MSSIADTGYLGYLCIAHTQYCTYTQKTSIASVSMDTAVSMRRPEEDNPDTGSHDRPYRTCKDGDGLHRPDGLADSRFTVGRKHKPDLD